MKYIDTHSHIHFEDFDNDRQEMSDRMSDSKVGTIAIGTDLKTSMQVVELAQSQKDIWACIGVHPNTHENFEPISTAVDSGEISMGRVVAVGECGLDYFRLESEKNNSGCIVTSQYIDTVKKEKQRQELLFRQHIEFAIKYKLPLMLHIRSSNNAEGQSTNDAHNDVLKILREYKDELGSDANKLKLHCHFTTFGKDLGQRFLVLDEHATFGIPGVVTYKNAQDLQELVKWLPLEKILAETDAPYAAPVPHRGKRNEPVFVIDTINAIADFRGEDREVVRKQLLENAQRVFNLSVEAV